MILALCPRLAAWSVSPGVKSKAPEGQGTDLTKHQAPSTKLDKTSQIIYDGDIMTNMKQELKKINDELMELYNKPSMALHFQPTNLRVLRRLITKLVLLEKEDEKN